MYCYSPCPQTCSRPPLTHAFAGDSWTPTGKSPVGSLFLSPGSWCIPFCCALQESISQSYVSSGSSRVGLMATSSKRIMPYPHPEPLFLQQITANQTSTGDTQTQFCLSLCGAPGSWCTRFCCALQESISPVLLSSGRSMVGLMATPSKRAYANPRLLHPEPLPLWQTKKQWKQCQTLCFGLQNHYRW